MGELDGVISDPDGFERIQLEAMRVLIGTVRMCYRIVKDVCPWRGWRGSWR